MHALTTGESSSAFFAFVVAAFTVAITMVILVTAVGLAQDGMVRSMKGGTRSVKRWGGAVLLVVGIWLLILAGWATQFARIFAV